MHFADQEKQDLFALVAGIMHMGEIKFKQRPREEQAECENQQGSAKIPRNPDISKTFGYGSYSFAKDFFCKRSKCSLLCRRRSGLQIVVSGQR